VAKYTADAKALNRQYRQRTRYLLDLLGFVQSQTSVDSIHDLRVTARRLLMMLRVLPRRLRGKRKAKEYDLALRSLLKATTQLRDSDILENILRSLDGSLPPDVLLNLKKERNNVALRAKEELNSLLTLTPSIDWTEIKDKKLSMRLNKRVEQRRRNVNALLRQVTSDESKVEELHALRKEVKKLRYLMELSQSPPMSELSRWQETLGNVHDLDVTISFLERIRYSPPVDSALNELRRKRHLEYSKFVRDWERGLSLSEGIPPSFTAMTFANP